MSGFAVSSDSSRVVYRADQPVDELHGLFSVRLAGLVRTLLNPPLVAGGEVQTDFAISPDSARVVYRADQNVDELFELYSRCGAARTS